MVPGTGTEDFISGRWDKQVGMSKKGVSPDCGTVRCGPYGCHSEKMRVSVNGTVKTGKEEQKARPRRDPKVIIGKRSEKQAEAGLEGERKKQQGIVK